MSAVADAWAPQAPPVMPLEHDLFGRALQNYTAGCGSHFFIRRDDNMVDRDELARYCGTWEQMPEHQRCLLKHARGRVLDFGAGAGQHTLALQQRGVDVTAIDISPRAVELCRSRGVRDVRLIDGRAPDFSEASFDTIFFLGNNMGIAGTPEGLFALLSRLRRVIRPGGQILTELTDYTATHNPTNLRYHKWNQARGRYPGSVRLRVEYDGHCGPWIDWLLPKLSDFRRIAVETDWKITRCIQVTTGVTYAIGMAPV